MLPTPAANLGTCGGGQPPERRRSQGHSVGLHDVVEYLPGALLPTPLSTDATKGSPRQKDSRGSVMLTGAVHRLLPTPTATQYGSNQSPSPGAAVRPSLATVGQAAASRLLPTPRARDHKGKDPNPNGVDLNQAIADLPGERLLPTPTSADGEGGRTRRGGARRGEKLLTGIARDAAAASTGARTPPLFDIGNPSSGDPFPIRS